jgi:flagellar biosynthesis/type III secretory pathway protein FliH
MNLEQRTQALLAVVEEFRRRRCAELLGPAEAQAREIVRGALAEARRRVHTAIAEERARIAAEVAAAQARLATERRLAAQRHATQLLAQAWDRLREALAARWRAPATRARWVEAHLARAMRALPAGAWTIRCAPDWPAAERDAALRWLADEGRRDVRIESDPTIAAGFRVHAGHNVLDATRDGLLADRAAIEGQLLELIEERT